MSQPTVLQKQTNELVGGESSRIPNGNESRDSVSAHIGVTDFGIFHDQIQDKMQKLQHGMAVVDNTITELTTTFGKYGKIVSKVGERYEKDQVLEGTIRELEATNAGIWKNIEQDRKFYKKEMSELKRKYEEEISTLEAKADAGEQEKRKYEELGRILDDEQKKAKQNMDKELQQKKAQLENETAEKMASLEREKMELQNVKARLQQELSQRTIERDQEKETRETMQNKAWTDIMNLEKKLADINSKYQLDQQPLHIYVDRYHGLIELVGNIATSYFTDLPNKAIDDPVGTSARLGRIAHSFKKVPIGNSDCSQVLRLANVQHIIFTVICDSVWQPIFSTYLWKHKRDSSTLPEIYSRLAAHGEDFQHNWKVSTLKILDQLDATVDLGELIEELIDQQIVATLQPLLDDSRLDLFKDEMKAVFTEATELGRLADRDRSSVYLDMIPSVSDRNGWKEMSEEYEISDVIDLSPTSPTTDVSIKPLFVSPKILRQGERVAPTAVASTSVTATTGRAEVEVIQPGVALFPGTGIFQKGALDWEMIRGAGTQVARNANGKVRRQSTSTSVTGSGIMPRSPLQPSKAWARGGTREFD